MFFEEKDVESWKNDIKHYFAEKKRKEVEPVHVKKVTHRDVKQKEVDYHPILQKFQSEDQEKRAVSRDFEAFKRTQDKKNAFSKKYEQNYDIITIENKPNAGKNEVSVEKVKKMLMPANQVDYNIITNTKFDENLFKNYEKLPTQTRKTEQKKVNFKQNRDFNIISNDFARNPEENAQAGKDQEKRVIPNKFAKPRTFNCVVGEFYDAERESLYKKERDEAQRNHGKNFSQRFPPSWKFRETVIMDPTKEVPEEIKTIDLQRKMQRKRYELRYHLENQYRERDVENQERSKFRIRNKLNMKKYTDEYNKGFDIITLGEIPEHVRNIQKYTHTKPFNTTWEKLQMTSHNFNKIATTNPSENQINSQ